MDPKRKRIYIIIIIVCVAGTIGILLWGGGGGGGDIPPAPTPSTQIPTQTDGSTIAAPAVNGIFPVPAVFPHNSKLDSSVLTSSAFRTLKTYLAPTIAPTELNRDDPFLPY